MVIPEGFVDSKILKILYHIGKATIKEKLTEISAFDIVFILRS
jgi:hypothetical protein